MNKKFKLFLFANTYNFFNSFMVNNIKHLSKKYELYIFCSDAKKLKKLIPNNVSLINIDFKRGLRLFYDIKTFFITLFFFLEKKPFLSLSFTPKIGFMVAIASFITRTPIRIHWYTGQIWIKKRGLVKIFYKHIDNLIFHLSNNVLVDSFSQRKFLIREKVITLKKSAVLHNGSVGGVNIKKFRYSKNKRIKIRKRLAISKNTFIFLYLGRINKDKGIKELVKAFEKIRDNFDALLIFVGSIEDDILTKLLINKKKILYFDFTNKPQDWFSVSDILCLPSYREGFGTVVIEAAACGLPALCSNIYGLQDSIKENKTGFFHKASSVDDIKKKMLYIIKNKKIVKKYGMDAKKRALKDFEQQLIANKLLEFINLNIVKNENSIFE